jgi:hypothetical protein
VGLGVALLAKEPALVDSIRALPWVKLLLI